MYYDDVEGLSIDWNPYERNRSNGSRAFIDAEILFKKGRLDMAEMKFGVAKSYYMSCANFYRIYKLGENIEMDNNVKKCEDYIAKCQAMKRGQSRAI